MRQLLGVLCFLVACSPGLAADAKKEASDVHKGHPSAKEVAPAPKPAAKDKDKAASCDKQASAKGLQGNERKAFVSKCLQW